MKKVKYTLLTIMIFLISGTVLSNYKANVDKKVSSDVSYEDRFYIGTENNIKLDFVGLEKKDVVKIKLDKSIKVDKVKGINRYELKNNDIIIRDAEEKVTIDLNISSEIKGLHESKVFLNEEEVHKDNFLFQEHVLTSMENLSNVLSIGNEANVKNEDEFVNALNDADIKKINIINSFSLESYTGRHTFTDRELEINGNGNTVDMRNNIILFKVESTLSSGENLTLRNLKLQGQYYLGMIGRDSFSKPKDVYCYDVKVEAANFNGASYPTNLIIEGQDNHFKFVKSYISDYDKKEYNTDIRASDAFLFCRGENIILKQGSSWKTGLIRAQDKFIAEEDSEIILDRTENSRMINSDSSTGSNHMAIWVNNKIDLRSNTNLIIKDYKFAIKNVDEINMEKNSNVEIISNGGIATNNELLTTQPKLTLNDGAKFIVKDDSGRLNSTQLYGKGAMFDTINILNGSRLNTERLISSNINIDKGSFKGKFLSPTKVYPKIKLGNVVVKNGDNFDENITKIWKPIYTADLVLSGNKVSGTVKSSSLLLENDFKNRFYPTYYTEIEPLPDVNLKLNSLNNIPISNNEYYITGEATPGSFIKFSGSNIPLPTEVEDTVDKTGKYHLKVDSTGKYSYKVTTPFKAGETITANGFLDGKTETVTTIVEEYIKIPDIVLSKVIYDELIALGKITLGTPNNDYFKKTDLESILKLKYDYNDQSIKGYGKIKSLENLKFLVNIETINFSTNEIENINDLTNLNKLKNINFEANKITNIDSLSNKNDLHEIILYSNNIANIDNLNNIPNLQGLYMALNKVNNISSVKNFPNLEVIDFYGNEVDNISDIQNLNKLKMVNFGDNKKIDDLTPVKNLLNIEDLVLSRNIIKDISPLENLKNSNLGSIYLEGNEIENVSYLKDFVNLRTLDISGNQISDISVLEDLLKSSSLSQFNATKQKVDLGKTKINGYEYELFNMVKTVPTGNITISNASGSGNIDSSTGLIKWTNLKSDVNPISFSFSESTGIKFDGTVAISIERILPMDPNNPDSKNNSPKDVPDFTGLGKAELAINYIEPIDFGTEDIGTKGMEIEAITNIPYIQISDLRENQTDGWELRVKADKLQNISGHTIEGASLELKNGQIKGSPTTLSTSDIENPDNNEHIIVLGDNQYKSILRKKTNNNIKGTWLKTWSGVGSKNENVILKLDGRKARVGNFKTTLHWELNIVP